MAKSFVRDSVGRFAKTAGKRVGKKIKKAVKDQASREVDRIDAAAQERLDRLADFQKSQRAQDRLAAAEKKLAIAKVEMEHAQTDGELEHGEAKLIRAQAARDKAAAAAKNLKGKKR